VPPLGVSNRLKKDNLYCNRQVPLSLLACRWRGKLVREETQGKQLRTFSVRFKNIVSEPAALWIFFSSNSIFEQKEILIKHKI